MCAGQVVFVLPICADKENLRCVQDRSYLYFLFLLPKRIKDVCRTGRICTSYLCCQREPKICVGQVVFVLPIFAAKENRRCVQDRSYLYFLFCCQRESKVCAGQVVFILLFLLPKIIEDVCRTGRIYIFYFAAKENRRCAQDRSYFYSYFCCQRESKMRAGQVVFLLSILLPKRIEDACRKGRIYTFYFCCQRELKMCVQDRSYLYFLVLLPKRIEDECRRGRICICYFCCQLQQFC
jgi:hypothetical protein